MYHDYYSGDSTFLDNQWYDPQDYYDPQDWSWLYPQEDWSWLYDPQDWSWLFNKSWSDSQLYDPQDWSWLSADPLALPQMPQGPVAFPGTTDWNTLYGDGTEEPQGPSGPEGPRVFNNVSGVTEPTTFPPTALPPTLGIPGSTTEPAPPPRPPTTGELQRQLLEKQIANMDNRGGMSAWAGPAVSGVTGLTGALLQYFGRPKARKPTPEEQAELAARTDLLKAQAEAARREPPVPPRPRGPIPPLRPGGPPNIDAFLKSLGATGGAGGPGGGGPFSTLLSSQAALGGTAPTGDFETRVQRIEQAEARQIHARYEKKRRQALEMANRLGQNPSGLLQALNEQEMQELRESRAQAEQKALAIEQAHAQVGQTRATTRATQLSPNLSFLQLLAQLFAQPAPGGEA